MTHVDEIGTILTGIPRLFMEISHFSLVFDSAFKSEIPHLLVAM